MKMKKAYFLIVLFLCGLSVGNVFAAAPAAGYLGNILRVAARDGLKTEVARVIAKGADVNAATQYGDTALMLAAAAGHENIVKMLLQVDGIDVNAQDHLGETALMSAAYYGDENIVKILLDAGANKTIQAADGRTAEAEARENRYEDLANMIRDYGSGRTVKSAGKKGKEEE